LKNRCGVSLAETLVGASLLLLVIGLFLPIWQIAMRTWLRSEEVQTTQRATLALSFRLRRDYLASRPDSLRVDRQAGQTLVSFQSYEAALGRESLWNSNGEILWRKWVQYQYHNKQVRRREQALPAPTQESPGPTPAWDPKDAHLVATHVENFEVVSPTQSLRLDVRILAREGKATSATSVSVLPALYGLDVLGN
jgi:hypothetical protein